MKRRHLLTTAAAAGLLASGCASTASPPQAAAPMLRGTGDLGVVVLRASGTLAVIDTSHRTLLGQVTGLGDLSHASVVFSRDARYAFVFGRDGGLSKVDLLAPGHHQPRDAGGQLHRRSHQRRRASGRGAELHTWRHQGVRCADARAGGRRASRVRAGKTLTRGGPRGPARPALCLQPVRRQ